MSETNYIDQVKQLVESSSKTQDTLTKMRVLQVVNNLMLSPRFKAMSALDVCQAIVDELRNEEVVR